MKGLPKLLWWICLHREDFGGNLRAEHLNPQHHERDRQNVGMIQSKYDDLSLPNVGPGLVIRPA